MRHILIFIFTAISFIAGAQNFSFDKGTITPFSATNAQLNIVQAPYKDGSAAMEWKWTNASVLKVDYAVTHKNFRDGVIFWIYNENPTNNPLKAEYRDANNTVQYAFEFGLNFKGWRICRIGSKYMTGPKQQSAGLKLHLVSPAGVSQGRLFIDRFSFVADVNYQNAPDAQQPNNTEAAYLIHWNSLWKWESTLSYTQALPANLSAAQTEALSKTEQAIASLLPAAANSSLINNAKNLFTNTGIKATENFLTGSPLVVKPDKKTGDLTFADLGTMMLGFAEDAVFNQNNTSKNNFLLLWDFALDQGFAYGSAMGNNHHYGYETRDIFRAAFLMRNELKTAGKLTNVAAALGFWSGLAESRAGYDISRDGVVDSWNTLLFERLISAMLIPAANERYRAVESLVRWTETSMNCTPGNMGGLKPDGSVFHHAGHYPAYAIGGLDGLGKFMAAIQPGGFKIKTEARRNMANALFAMSRYTNFRDWTIGIAGRHPHTGGMSQDVVNAFAYLALMGGIENPTDSYDKKLAAEYLCLETENTTLKSRFSGLAANDFTQGFFVMNHAALGIHRFGNSLVTIKGYNSDVWGSEIYTADNRYGRYQSYGAVEILNGGSPVSRSESRFSENGWDWNRLPGTTTIHLPLQLLESPVSGTLMARSEEDFAGASSLLGQYGIFGMKLKEKNDINNTNFTPEFTARKSVFTFGKRIICIGTDINNNNADFVTETTLFQNSIKNSTEKISVNGTFTNINDYSFDSGIATAPTVLSDLSGNFYRISERNRVLISGGEQVSAHNKTKAETRGNFVTARIDHGQAPIDGHYEYMIMLKPSPAEQRNWCSKPEYQVIRADKTAHIVFDEISKTTAIVSFELTRLVQSLIKSISEETLLMYNETDNGTIAMSVCDPSLHFPEKTKNSESTMLPGAVVQKQILIEGAKELVNPNEAVEISYQNGNTLLTVNCQLGIPVEFVLKNTVSNTENTTENKLKISKNDNSLTIHGQTDAATLFDSTGRMLENQTFSSMEKTFYTDKNQIYFLWAQLSDNSVFTRKLML